MEIAKVGTALSKVFGRTGLLIQKYSPEILMVTGVASIIGGAFLACKATLKLEQKIDEAKLEISDLKENGPKDNKIEMVKVYSGITMKFVKLYGPAISLGLGGIGCILGSHGIMKRRNVALIAAYKVVEEGFNAYRKRVVEEHGEDKDYMYKNGYRQEQITETEVAKDGTKKKTKKTVMVNDTNDISVYARFFDAGCREWSKTPEYNLLYLRNQQAYFNNMLIARGHVFLNEVYDALGIPRTQAGAVVGWVLQEEGDNFVDFGIYEDKGTGKEKDFVNGYERSILLDFNVDGVIYDAI